MTEGSGEHQRYCGNCGAEVRPGNAFCVSCGEPLAPTAQESGPTEAGPPPSERPNPFDVLVLQLRRALNRVRQGFSGVGGDRLQRLPARTLQWFRDLPSVPKLVIVGLALLVVLILLSPVAVIICALLLGVSIIALIIRVAQRRSVKNWGIVAVASVVLMFTFGATSEGLYGIGFLGLSRSDSSGGGEKDTASSSTGGGASPVADDTLAVGDKVSFTARPWGTAEEVNLDGRPFVAVVFEISGGEHIQVVSSLFSEDSGGTYYELVNLGGMAQFGEAMTVNIEGVYLGTYGSAAGSSYETFEAYSISEGTGSEE
jgi:zinc-ribbon domain